MGHIISEPPTPTVSYRGLLLKDLSLEVALNGLYLNVTALVIVNYVACIDPKSYLFSSGSFTICPQKPCSLCNHTHSSVRVSAASVFFCVQGDLISFLNAL